MNKMKRVWFPLMAILVVMSLAGLALAQQPVKPLEPGQSIAPTEKPEATKEATGKVVKADLAKKVLVVNTNGRDITFTIADKAAKDLANIKPGDMVTVQYSEAGGKLTAQSIRKG